MWQTDQLTDRHRTAAKTAFTHSVGRQNVTYYSRRQADVQHDLYKLCSEFEKQLQCTETVYESERESAPALYCHCPLY